MYGSECKKPKVEPTQDNPIVKVEASSDVIGGRPQQQVVLPSVQLFGTEVQYRSYGRIILFKTSSVLELVRRWFPIAVDVQRTLSAPQVL